MAAARPLPKVHSIWELVLHIASHPAASRRLERRKVSTYRPSKFSTGVRLLPRVAQGRSRDQTHTLEALIKTVAAPPDRASANAFPQRYDFSHMLYGVVQHELYHAGQIAVLEKQHSAGFSCKSSALDLGLGFMASNPRPRLRDQPEHPRPWRHHFLIFLRPRRRMDQREPCQVIPPQRLLQIQHGECGQDSKGNDFLHRLKLGRGELARADAVCRDLETIFKERDQPVATTITL